MPFLWQHLQIGEANSATMAHARGNDESSGSAHHDTGHPVVPHREPRLGQEELVRKVQPSPSAGSIAGAARGVCTNFATKFNCFFFTPRYTYVRKNI